jgi:KDO2-lipid IV(A) lauroyltransferase
MRLTGWLPAEAVRAFARIAGSVAWFTWRARRETIDANMRYLVREASRRRALGARVLPNLMEAATDLWRLPSASRDEVAGMVEAQGLEHLQAALLEGRGVILAGGHLGPYELGGAWLASRGFPVHAMVERLPPETAGAMAAYRTSTGMHLIDRSTGPRALLRVLRAGEAVALICDRMVGTGAPGQVVSFGQGSREIPSGPASFALATGARVVTGCIVRREAPGARYVMSLAPPIDPTDHTVTSLTALIGTRLSEMATAHPDEWYVFQPDWRDDAR